MATPLATVYDAFLAKLLDDEWDDWALVDVEKDLRAILDGAIPWFKFPRVSLEINQEGTSFIEELSNDEIQVLANFMVVEWLRRTILRWENIKPLYEERDFSQANFLNKLNEAFRIQEKYASKKEHLYYRVRNRNPFPYRNLADGKSKN